MGLLDLAQFQAALPDKGALLGLDPGEKRIGVAVSDPTRLIASPLATQPKRKLQEDLTALLAFLDGRSCVGVVVGWPLTLEGRVGPAAQASRAFANNLLKRRDLPVLLWDERLSTAAVQRQMIAADVSRATRAAVVDAQAAAFMLQGALDRLRA
jgi:putative Holliday junction resolvase